MPEIVFSLQFLIVSMNLLSNGMVSAIVKAITSVRCGKLKMIHILAFLVLWVPDWCSDGRSYCPEKSCYENEKALTKTMPFYKLTVNSITDVTS